MDYKGLLIVYFLIMYKVFIILILYYYPVFLEKERRREIRESRYTEMEGKHHENIKKFI